MWYIATVCVKYQAAKQGGRIRVISSETNSLDQRPFVEDRTWIQIKLSGQAKFSPYCQISWTPGSVLLAKSELHGQRATSVQGVAIHPGRNAERALEGLGAYPRIEVLYWMHQARRDVLIQVPRVSGKPFGTFALRSPERPNPIASLVVDFVSIAGISSLSTGWIAWTARRGSTLGRHVITRRPFM